MRTEHMTTRMRQRRIAEAEINVILELGELNERADRLVLTAQSCAREEAALRKEIEYLERKVRKARQ
jgi:cell division protein FtsB